MTSSTAAIHVAKKQLGLDDETYRAKLVKIVGKPSTKEMTEGERQRVLQVFENEGFTRKPGTSSVRSRADTLSGRYAAAIRAFWLSGYNLGVFHDPDDRAILKFARRQTGLGHVQFAVSAAHGKAIIEAIKAIVRRDAEQPDLWRPVKNMPRSHSCQDARVQVLQAQFAILTRMGAAPAARLLDLLPGVGVAIYNLDGAPLVEFQKRLGILIRAARQKEAV